eukprot:TRINITY_DN3231_c1_g1_i2.p1 TRINITY_DN3231_c1_g1~~TRINITY_DN3231_c1_g1_i2.p1  ORF type:complete len:279 (+),score=73.89 TRINITY_DN3231_c1_g1_i2:50-838(+)
MSEIGPVRACFVVTKKGADGKASCSGVGYVRFAAEADAERCIAQAKEKKLTVGERKVRVSKASSVPATPGGGDTATKKRKRDESAEPVDSATMQAAVTKPVIVAAPVEKPAKIDKKTTFRVLITASADTSKRQLYALLKKTIRLNPSDLQFPLSTDSTGKHHGAVNCQSMKDLVATLGLSKENLVFQRESQAKSARVIVRNLFFKATEDDVRRAFSRFGEISEVQLPKKENGLSRGFAFVQFFDKDAAAKVSFFQVNAVLAT